jgi:S1-C subfamily serine protease
MSQTYDPNESERNQSYPAGPAFGGGADYPGNYAGAGFASEPPPPPRRNHKRGLAITGVVALAAGAAAGGLIGSMNHSAVGLVTATSKTALSTSQIASRVDPALVDIVSTDGDQQATSAGTGIVLTASGLVLTNNHVINGATSIKVTDIGNGKTYTGKVVGYDASHDVAVVQMQNASGLTAASLGNSSTVQTGDNVVALGNAGGKGGTPSVAAGTVTALNQSITASDEDSSSSERLTDMIETNADIQPGDSGGPLVNSAGQVIGMDTAASSGSDGPSYQDPYGNSPYGNGGSSNGQSPYGQSPWWQFPNGQSPYGQNGSGQNPSGQSSASSSDQSRTEGFAIPINRALSIASEIEGGHASSSVHIGATGFLGVELSTQGSSEFGGFGGPSASGIAVEGVLSGSPAAAAGLSQGDVITSVAGQSVSSPSGVESIIEQYHPGDKVSVGWADQSGQSRTSTLTLANGPAD